MLPPTFTCRLGYVGQGDVDARLDHHERYLDSGAAPMHELARGVPGAEVESYELYPPKLYAAMRRIALRSMGGDAANHGAAAEKAVMNLMEPGGCLALQGAMVDARRDDAPPPIMLLNTADGGVMAPWASQTYCALHQQTVCDRFVNKRRDDVNGARSADNPSASPTAYWILAAHLPPEKVSNIMLRLRGGGNR